MSASFINIMHLYYCQINSNMYLQKQNMNKKNVYFVVIKCYFGFNI